MYIYKLFIYTYIRKNFNIFMVEVFFLLLIFILVSVIAVERVTTVLVGI